MKPQRPPTGQAEEYFVYSKRISFKRYEAQLLTYLRATNKRIGLLINFNTYILGRG